MKLDLVDIGLHCLFAVAWGFFCGVPFNMGYHTIALMGMAVGGGFWIAREQMQHKGEIRLHWYSQSMWEWIAPNIVSAVAMIATVLIL